MFYKKIIKDLMQVKKNPVNSMYLHEINLKWSAFEKLTEENESVKNAELVVALNDFLSALKNKKYLYNKSTGNGFKPESPIFSISYLHDLISIMIERNNIIGKPGIIWDYQSFSTELKFNPQNLGVMDRDMRFEQILSEKLLCLTQKLDFQFRVRGKRNFQKYEIIFPLVIFFTSKILDESSFIKANHTSKKAKASFERSRTVIVTETIDNKFIPDLDSSSIDTIFILRKQSGRNIINPIAEEVVNKLDRKITEFLTESESVDTDFIKKGYLM